MICIYSQNNTEYTKNGDAVLIPTSVEVSMTINGAWQLTLEHPYDPEERYKYIVEGAVIRVDLPCIAELSSIQQRFRVYHYQKDLHSVSCIAFPVAMESTYDAPIDNLVISNKTGSQAMTALQAYAGEKYTLATDITASKSTSFANTNINAAISSGDDNCFIKTWGGEILYDNLTFNVKQRLGDDTATDHPIIYGRNLTGITYEKDDSGLVTRIKPISQDGIRLNGTGYVDSSHVLDYPVIHTQYMTAPYSLIDSDSSHPTQTAALTAQAGAAISASASTTSQSSYATALSNGYQPEYIKTIKEDIVSAVQTMAVAHVISTSYYSYCQSVIASAMSWISDLEQPAWDWHGSYESGWRYGNDDGYAKNMYVRIGKTWTYFGSNGYWEEPRNDSEEWNWYQTSDETGKKYGNFTHYYAHNTYVYITKSGTLKKYWFDEEGWYDSDKTDDSDWTWHGSGTGADPWWFGEEGAGDDDKKYAHSVWLFIDGTYYFFDEFGYYDGSTKIDSYPWDWVDAGNGDYWFGNAIDKEMNAAYLTSQWEKINGSWYYFDSNGYVAQENAVKATAVAVFTSGMSTLQGVVDDWSTSLYTLLYQLMTASCNSVFASGADIPAVTISVDMADLSKTTEYADFSDLETIKLGDSVKCVDNEHNIETTSRVIGITYDCIRGYNAKVVIGKAASTVAEIIGNANGVAVSGGLDLSAINEQIEDIQDSMMTDLFLNDQSVVTGGVGRLGILAGDNVNISRSGNNLTINAAGGGGLKYWVEDTNKITRHVSNGVSPWDCDSAYKKGQFQITNPVENYIVKKNNNVACCATYSFEENGQKRTFPMIISTEELDTIVHHWGHHDMGGKSFTVNGITLYYSECTYNAMWGDCTISGDVPPYLGDFTDKYHEFNDNSFLTQAYVRDLLISKANFHTTAVNYSGIGGNNSEYVSWGGRYYSIGDENPTPDNMPFFVRRNGEVNGSAFKVNGKTVQLDTLVDGESVVGDDGIGRIALASVYATKTELAAKQDTIIAGTNITIGSDGKTINATNTTYSEFTGATSSTSGTSGLVPAPSSGDQDKVLCGDGTWKPQSGGLTPVEIEWSQYQQLTPEQRVDPTINYYVKNCPDDNYLTIQDGKLCIVYDDGQ